MIHTNRTITIISNHISLSPPLTKTTYYDDMGKSRVPIAAMILLSISACVHQSGGVSQQLYEYASGIAYLGAEAFNIFMLVP